MTRDTIHINVFILCYFFACIFVRFINGNWAIHWRMCNGNINFHGSIFNATMIHFPLIKPFLFKRPSHSCWIGSRAKHHPVDGNVNIYHNIHAIQITFGKSHVENYFQSLEYFKCKIECSMHRNETNCAVWWLKAHTEGKKFDRCWKKVVVQYPFE